MVMVWVKDNKIKLSPISNDYATNYKTKYDHKYIYFNPAMIVLYCPEQLYLVFFNISVRPAKMKYFRDGQFAST